MRLYVSQSFCGKIKAMTRNGSVLAVLGRVQGGICREGEGDVSWSLDFGTPPPLELIQTCLGGTHLTPLTRIRLSGEYHLTSIIA